MFDIDNSGSVDIDEFQKILQANTGVKLSSMKETPSDVMALCSFVRSRYTDRQVKAALLANGLLPVEALRDYVGVVQRMRAEVHSWLWNSGSPFIQELVGRC